MTMTTQPFAGKVAIVTGAGSGIGEAIARLLAERGAKLLIVERDPQGGEAILNDLAKSTDTALAIGDASDPDVCDRAIRAALDRWSRLDILVNNAGGGRLVPTETLTTGDWREMQADNIDTAFFMSRAALRAMLAQGAGAIVNIASVHGHLGLVQHVAYGAAKGAVVNMTRAMAVEFAARGIRVNSVSPGVIRTPAFDRAVGEDAAKTFLDLHPMRRLGTPLDVAQAVCFLASEEATFITGPDLMVDGGFSAQ